MAFDYSKPTSFGGNSKIAMVWSQLNIVTSQASVAMQIGGVAAMTQAGMLYDGQILGIVAHANTPITASTIRFIPTINGVTVTALAATNSATGVSTLSASASVADPYATSTRKFVAGDRLGVKHSTTASYAPATADWTATMYLEI